MTNQELLDYAAYELGYIEYGASLDATDAADALATLNDMMAEWEINDKYMDWFPQDTLGDTAPIPAWASSGVKSSLAMRLGAVFNVAPSQALALKADIGERTIANHVINTDLTGSDMSHLGHSGRWDIETDV